MRMRAAMVQMEIGKYSTSADADVYLRTQNLVEDEITPAALRPPFVPAPSSAVALDRLWRECCTGRGV